MTLDIIIPAYNEEVRIGRTLAAYRSGFPRSDVRFHVALDGCSDRTAEIVLAHRAQDPRVQLHSYLKMGKGGVLIETFRRCDAELVAFVDADCATPPAELGRLLDFMPDADGVIANRRHPSSFTPAPRAAGRSLTSDGFAWGIRHLFDLPFTDTQCGAKIVRREVAQRVMPFMTSRDFLFDVDLLILTSRLGYRIVEIPTLWIDQAGSKLGARRDAVRMLKSALRLWVHHTTLPVDAPVPVGARPVAPVIGLPKQRVDRLAPAADRSAGHAA